MLIYVFEKHSGKKGSKSVRCPVCWGSCWLCGLVRRL